MLPSAGRDGVRIRSGSTDEVGDGERNVDGAGRGAGAGMAAAAAAVAEEEEEDPSRDDDAEARKRELWEQWWFEARNAGALEVGMLDSSRNRHVTGNQFTQCTRIHSGFHDVASTIFYRQCIVSR